MDIWGILSSLILSPRPRLSQRVMSPLQELVLLTVHGTLHLLGFDHDTPTRKGEMWHTQQQIMAELNLAHVQPTET